MERRGTQMRRCLSIFLLLNLVIASNADDFDNWFFDFFEGEYMSVGLLYLSTEDLHRWTVLSESTGQKIDGGRKFLVKGEYSYFKMNKTESYTVIWTKVNDSRFSGKFVGDSGITGDLLLLLEENSKFETTAKYSDGTSSRDHGELLEGGKLYVTGTVAGGVPKLEYRAKKLYEKKLPQKDR